MKKYKFKSSTDVNNYNKFLLDLDGIIKKTIAEKKDEKRTIQTCVDDINKAYDENNGFNTMSKLDILCNAIDPNEYLEPVPDVKTRELTKELKKIHKKFTKNNSNM